MTALLVTRLKQRCRSATMALGFALLVTTGTAWSQTPTLVQHFYTGTNSPPRGLDAPNYTFRLPNKTLPGNCLVMFIDYPHGSLVTSIDDDRGNSWPATAAVVADGGVGSPVTAVYVLPNAQSGTREITVTFNTDVTGVHAAFLEYYNVATSAAVGSTASRGSAVSPSITSGALVPSPAASGNLVLNYAMDNEGQVGAQSASAVTAWAAGSGWTMLGGDINNSHDTSSFALQARIADGTNFNPTMAATQARADGFNSVAVELRAANAGTAPAAGIRIVKQQFYVHTALAVPGTWREFFPAQGNLLAAISIYHGSTTSPLSDSNGNHWTQAHTNSGVPAMQYAQNAVTSSTLAVTIPLTSVTSNTTIVLFDIVGAAASDVLAQAITGDSRGANGASSVTNAPSITPLNPNGLIITATAFGQGPVTGFAAGAPPSALFMPVTYPGETDLDTFNNADAYANSSYGTDLSPQHYNWTLIPQPSNSFEAASIELKSGTGTSPPAAPSDLTAAAASTTQINLAWTAPPNTTVTGYLVERCQQSGCTNFAQTTIVTGTAYNDTSLAPSTTYRYRIRASLPNGSTTGYSNIATATTLTPQDSNPPSAPTNLTATQVSASRIDLTWTAATDDVGVTGYRVERCQGIGCAAFAQIAALSSSSFSDTGLAGGTSYGYRVRAVDAAGNLGGYSNVSSATTPAAPDTTPPTPPTGLNASVVNSSQINLLWTAATDSVGVTGYRVWRCQGSSCSNFAQLATVTSTSYGDSGLTASTTYRYRIQAVDAAGNVSSDSNIVSATTPGVPDVTPPSAPTALSATAAGANQINLAWTAATDNAGVTGYRLERCQGAGCNAFAEIAAPPSVSFNDSSVVPGTSYGYRVRAVDAAGNLGGYSNVASASTSSGTPPPSSIAFVQGNYATPQSPTSTVSVKYAAAQNSGDLNVVIVGWSDSKAVVTAITDTFGNVYAIAAAPTIYQGAVTQVIYYAKNIAAAPAGTNTVTVQFSAAATYPDVRILNYSGLDRMNPLDAAAGASGNNASSDSGVVTTTSSNELLVAGNTVWSTTSGPGPGFVKRMITWPDGDIAQDQVVTSAGSYRATAPLDPAPWVMQLVTFKAASN